MQLCCFVQIVAAIVDPLIQMCSLSASRLSTVDMATYMINCLHKIQTTIALYEFTEQKLEILQAQVSCYCLFELVILIKQSI